MEVKVGKVLPVPVGLIPRTLSPSVIGAKSSF